jgi:hypothetical protein
MRSPGTAGPGSFCRDGQVCNMTDASQRFTSKAISSNRSQILELLELRRGESFTEDWEIISLECVSEKGDIELFLS